MTGATFLGSARVQLRQLWAGLLAMPLQARTLVFIAAPITALFVLLLFGAVITWWMDSANAIGGSEPHISRLMGYIEAEPRIDQALGELNSALSEVAIEDTGDTGRGGAILQQQLRDLAKRSGLTVVGSEVREPEKLDALVRLNATIQVSGDPASFDQFSRLLLESSPTLFPSQIRFDATRRVNRRMRPESLRGQEANVNARLEVSAYRLSKPDV